MRWPDALAALVAHLEADPVLLAALGGEPRIYPADDPHAGRIPSVWYLVVSEPDGQVWEEPLVQWNWNGSADERETIERRLRALVCPRLPKLIGGVWITGRREDVRSSMGQMDVRYTLEREEEE